MARCLVFLILIWTSICCSSAVLLSGLCYNIPMEPDFDAQKFADGVWYEIEKYDTSFEAQARCVKLTFFADSLTQDLDIVFQLKYPDGTSHILFGEAHLKGNESQARFPNDSMWSSFSILSNDYDDYGIIYSCVQTNDDVSLPEKQERLWVLGRGRLLTSETLAAVNETLTSYSDDLMSYFTETDQNCTEAYIEVDV